MIRIHLTDGKALVWNVDDAREIREQHGLVGNLVGALVRKPRQNLRLGLPLQLLPEETRLLVEIGAASLVHHSLSEKDRSEEDSSMGQSNSPSSTGDQDSLQAEVDAYGEYLEKSYSEQRELALAEKRRILESLSDRIVEERTRRRKRRDDISETPMESSSQGSVKELQDLEANFHFPREAMMVHLPTARPSLGVVQEVDVCQASPDWPYAGQPEHETRYKVFKDLWERGYFLTSGNKFGGDFLVYPGDPMRYHAHFITICVPYNKEIPMSDIVTAGRLGTNVKKTVLLCSPNEEGKVTYTSLQWSGMQ